MSEIKRDEKLLTTAEIKKLLTSLGEENLDQLQRRTLDYTSKFSKVKEDSVEQLVKALIEEFDLKPEEAVQIVNCMPGSIEELRVFLAGGRKIMETSKLKALLDLLLKNRKTE